MFGDTFELTLQLRNSKMYESDNLGDVEPVALFCHVFILFSWEGREGREAVFDT